MCRPHARVDVSRAGRFRHPVSPGNVAMNPEIEFGEVEEAPRETRLRPDRNKHFAVVPVFAPDDGDLPVFVDVDAACDMEEHALTDTGVELGGVLLGGHYEDSDGRPFVLVTDSLRAKHYESTKGSFKFTHDTWAEITRERDEFPDELQMVGWYHTHPDWGVFLSSMDMFICDHFFNKPLDVALVIDPCRQDRGFFQWTGNPRQRVRRTSGFYLVASRFRADELQDVAQRLEGNQDMAQESRFLGSRSSAPVVNISGAQPPWLSTALLGMLMLQFCFLVLIALRLLLPDGAGGTGAPQLETLQQSVDRLAEVRRLESQVDAKLEVVNQLVGRWDGTAEGMASELAARQLQNDNLQIDLQAARSLAVEQNKKIDELDNELILARLRAENTQQKIASLETKVERLSARNRELAAMGEDVGAGDEQQIAWWVWPAVGGSLALVIAAAVVAAVITRRGEQAAGEQLDEEEIPDDSMDQPNS